MANMQANENLKSGYFTDIGASSVETVADRHRHAAYVNTAKKLVTSACNDRHWWRAF